MGDDRGNVYWDPTIDKWVYRASGLGNCLAALVRERMGETPMMPPDWLQTKYDQGTNLEQQVLHYKTIGEKHWRVLDDPNNCPLDFPYSQGVDASGQLCIEIPVGPSAIVRCHPDGIAEYEGSNMAQGLGSSGASGFNSIERLKTAAVDGDDTARAMWRVVEGKALSEAYYKTVQKQLPEFYKWQLSVEMAGTHLLALYLYGVKTENGESLSTVNVELINEPPYTLPQIKMRVLQVERMAEAGEIPECEFKQYPCGFWQTHDVSKGIWAKDKPVSDLDEEVIREINFHAHHYRMYSDKAAGYDEKRKEAKDKLLELFGRESGVDVGKVMHTDMFTVTRIESTRPGSIKAKDMEKDGIDVEKYRGKSVTSVYVKVDKAEKDDRENSDG